MISPKRGERLAASVVGRFCLKIGCRFLIIKASFICYGGIVMIGKICRERIFTIIICIVCMTGIPVLRISAFADGEGAIQEETVVTLSWENSDIVVGTTEWNDHSVPIHTEDIGMGNRKVYDFVGVTLFDLMKLAGADECTKALVKSTDGLIGEVSAEDIRNYDIALVNGYADGKPIKADAGGPLKIVFPVTEHPELKDRYTVRAWQWYVCEVAFTRQQADVSAKEADRQSANAISENSGTQSITESPGESVTQTANVSSEKFGHADQCVIIILDGFSSNYLSRLGTDSSLAGIAQEGACCLTARSTYPSHTCTNHATIMTGVGAAKHGIVGNDHLGEDGISSVRNIQPEMIRVPTLVQIASAEGKKTAFVSGKDNMVTLFSEALDVGVSNKRLKEYLTIPPELSDSNDNDEYFQYNMDLADWVFESLFTVLEKEKPDLTVVNIQSTDYIGHRFGPDSKEMTACLEALDERIGELVRKMDKAGMLEDTAVIVTADHGMTTSEKAIPLTALSFMNFPTAGAVIDGRNGYIWYGSEERDAVISFYENVEGVRNVFERDSDEAETLNVNAADGPDLFLETEPGYVFLPEPMIGLYHGQHGSRDDSDMIIPIICIGSGIPSGVGIESCDLRCIAPVVCHLMSLPSGNFDLGIPALLETQDRTILG